MAVCDDVACGIAAGPPFAHAAMDAIAHAALNISRTARYRIGPTPADNNQCRFKEILCEACACAKCLTAQGPVMRTSDDARRCMYRYSIMRRTYRYRRSRNRIRTVRARPQAAF